MGMAAQQPLLLRDCFSYHRLRLCFRPCLCLCFCLWRTLRRPCLHRCRHHVYIGCFTRTCNNFGLAAVVNGEHERSNGVIQCRLSLNRWTCIFFVAGTASRLVEADMSLVSTVVVAVPEGLRRPSCRSRDIGLGTQELSDRLVVLRVSSHGPAVVV